MKKTSKETQRKNSDEAILKFVKNLSKGKAKARIVMKPLEECSGWTAEV